MNRRREILKWLGVGTTSWVLFAYSGPFFMTGVTAVALWAMIGREVGLRVLPLRTMVPSLSLFVLIMWACEKLMARPVPSIVVAKELPGRGIATWSNCQVLSVLSAATIDRARKRSTQAALELDSGVDVDALMIIVPLVVLVLVLTAIGLAISSDTGLRRNPRLAWLCFGQFTIPVALFSWAIVLACRPTERDPLGIETAIAFALGIVAPPTIGTTLIVRGKNARWPMVLMSSATTIAGAYSLLFWFLAQADI